MEILAPVGSQSALKVAVYNGANAVYLGLDSFNARAKAEGFNRDNIAETIDFCHLHGVKVYITFNTNIKESEVELLGEYMKACADAKADAFIITDMACLVHASQFKVPLHASTQMGIHELNGAKIAEKLGFTRVVLSREATLEDIKQIKKYTNLEVEYFVHGALCVAFSGKCLLSALANGDSGNRGRCNQLCRLSYKNSINGKDKYYLSPSDQCLISKLNELKKVGVDSLKIEGRLKAPHYVGAVVREYAKVLNRLDYDIEQLKRAFNRGDFTLGYNFDDTSNIMSSDIQSNIGVKVGRVVGSQGKYSVIRFDEQPHIGNGLKIIRDKEELGGFQLDNFEKKPNGDYLVATLKKYPLGSEVHLTFDAMQAKEIESFEKKIPVDISVEAFSDKELRVKFSCGNLSYSFVGGVCDKALTKALSKEDLKISISRLGESEFIANNIIVNTDSVFIPKSIINSARRNCVDGLKRVILCDYQDKMQQINIKDNLLALEKPGDDNNFEITKPFVLLQHSSQLSKEIIEKSNIVYEITDILSEDIIEFLRLCKSFNNDKIYVLLPTICRYKDKKLLENYLNKHIDGICGIVCDNLYAIQTAKDLGVIAIGGIGLNIYNSYAYGIYEKLGLNGMIAAVELTANESFNTFKDCKNVINYAFGCVPTMLLTHCPVQNITGCKCNNCRYTGEFNLVGKDKHKLIRKRLNSCYFEVISDKVINLLAIKENYAFKYYINMLNFNKEECIQILKAFELHRNTLPYKTLEIMHKGVK